LVIYTGEIMQEKVILKISTRAGSRIESVPLLKLKKLANNEKRWWKLESTEKGEWLILNGYS